MKNKLFISLLLSSSMVAAENQMHQLEFNNPGLVVNLSAGLQPWPVPMDADGDGDYDLLLSVPGKPSNGTYFFENTDGDTADNKFPIFKNGQHISKGYYDVTPSYVDNRIVVAVRNLEFPDFALNGLKNPQASGKLQANVHPRRLHLNQWRYVDYNGDNVLDLSIGVTDWGDYGWDNFGPFKLGFDKTGKWTGGPLRGYIYILINTGTTAKPVYGKAKKLWAGGSIIDGYGIPSQSFEDFDGDGDLDLITGEFLDSFTYYRNTGTRTKPEYATGQKLPFTMDMEFIIVTALDWDKDEDIDLLATQEDGRVALIEHTGEISPLTQLPVFEPPRYFQQQAGAVKFGALVTPFGIDWDNDGDDDIISGNTAGRIGFIENLAGTGNKPVWAAPKYLSVDGQVIRIMAGPNGSVQGPSESKWGYTTLSVADWDADGLHDLVVNSIWGKVIWYRNIGTPTAPKLAAAQAIEVQPGNNKPKPAWNWWEPKDNELVTQWRTTPVAFDWNQDGLMDIVMLDQEGYLAFFRRTYKNNHLVLLAPERIFVNEYAEPLKLSRGDNGASGRRKLHLIDWDGDRKTDLLVDDIKTNTRFYKNISQNTKQVVFKDMGPLNPHELARHTTSPTTVDWDNNDIPDLLVGAEDGHFYYMVNPRAKP